MDEYQPGQFVWVRFGSDKRRLAVIFRRTRTRYIVRKRVTTTGEWNRELAIRPRDILGPADPVPGAPIPEGM